MTPIEEIARFANVPVGLEVILDKYKMTVRELLELECGSVIPLERSAGENVDIYVSQVLVGFGEIVVIENTTGVRITDFKTED